MALVIISKKKNQQIWRKALLSLMPDLDVRIYPDDDHREEVDFALVWHPPLGVFKHYPNLKAIASTGAGVDHILKDPSIKEDTIITRVVDDTLTRDMSLYLIAQVMNHVRGIAEYRLRQQVQMWQPENYLSEAKIRIGIMGMGILGTAAAIKFKCLGLRVHGWARNPKNIDDIKVYAGNNEYNEFLNNTDILICLLPLTPGTTNILNRQTFNQLPKEAFLINVARGEHLVDQDLVDAINANHLSGACLDVFREEPLPKEHVFWQHKKINITPHVASITSPEHVAPQILDNYQRLCNGEELTNVVSLTKGY